MKTDGLDDALSELNRLGDRGGQIIAEMAEAGAAAVADAWKKAASSHGHVKTGAMLAAITHGKGKKSPSSVKYEIYPRGKDAKGTSNAEKAFILHYGTSSIPASHWVDDAEQEGEPAADAAMLAVFDRMMKEGGG